MAKDLKSRGKASSTGKVETRKGDGWLSRDIPTRNFDRPIEAEYDVARPLEESDLKRYIPGHIRVTSFIYESEEVEILRMVNIGSRVAARKK